MHYELGTFYGWIDGDGVLGRHVFVEEARALGGSEPGVADGVPQVLAFAARLAAGRQYPVPGWCWEVTDLNERIYYYSCAGVILFYAMEAPQRRGRKRPVFLLKCAKARSAQPAVADMEEAERRLRAWRQRDRTDADTKANGRTEP